MTDGIGGIRIDTSVKWRIRRETVSCSSLFCRRRVMPAHIAGPLLAFDKMTYFSGICIVFKEKISFFNFWRYQGLCGRFQALDLPPVDLFEIAGGA
jgi:hypothetical protein